MEKEKVEKTKADDILKENERRLARIHAVFQPNHGAGKHWKEDKGCYQRLPDKGTMAA